MTRSSRSPARRLALCPLLAAVLVCAALLAAGTPTALAQPSSADGPLMARVAVAPVTLMSAPTEDARTIAAAVEESVYAYLDTYYSFETVPMNRLHDALVPMDIEGGVGKEQAMTLAASVRADYVIALSLDLGLSGIVARGSWFTADGDEPHRIEQRCDVADPWPGLLAFSKYVALAMRDDARYPRSNAERVRAVAPVCGLVGTATQLGSARLAMIRGDLEGAISNARSARSAESSCVRALELEAHAQLMKANQGIASQADLADLVAELRAAMSAREWNADLPRWLGMAHLAIAKLAGETGDEEAVVQARDAARTAFQASLSLNPRQLRVYEKLALSLGDGPDAAADARRALGANHPGAMRLHALALYVSNDLDAATVLVADAHARHPGHPRITLLYADVMTAAGRTDEALAALDDAAESWPDHQSITMATFRARYADDPDAASTMHAALVAFALNGRGADEQLSACLFGRGALDVTAIAREAELHPLDSTYSLILWGLYAWYISRGEDDIEPNAIAKQHANRYVELGGRAANVLRWLEPWREPAVRFTRVVEIPGGIWQDDE